MSAARSSRLLATAIAAVLLSTGCGGDSGEREKLNPGSTETSAQGASPGPIPADGESASGGSTPVLKDETAADYAARAFAVFNAASAAKSCEQADQFYRDFLLPELATVLTSAPAGCDDAALDTRFTYRVTGVSTFDPKNFSADPIPDQALAPLASTERVVRVDLARTKDQDFATFWLVVRKNDRFYLFHPVLFQISSCFDERFALLPDAPSWCR